MWLTLRKKCLYSDLFWSTFSRIRTEYGEILCISPYSVRMGENADQINSEYRHFSRSVNPLETVKNLIFCAVTFLQFFLANIIHMIDYS